MCRDCKDAMRDASTHDASARQGETPLLTTPGGNSAAPGTQELDDPAVQLANLTIDLDDNCVERIKVKDNESAEEVARKVCRSNNLPGQFVALLAEHIIDRYPRRPVDQKPEEAAAVAGGEETRDSKPGRSQNEGTTIRESPHKI